MAFLLNFIFLIIFIMFLAVCMTAWRIYRSFRSMADRLKNGHGQAGSSSWQGDRHGRADEDEVIIDRRTPDEANRKIFSDGEGEYVDYVEEK